MAKVGKMKVKIDVVTNVPQGSRLILIADNALDLLGTRTEEGLSLKLGWGERSPEGWYRVTSTVTNDGWLDKIKKEEYERGYRKGLSFKLRK